MFSIFRKKITKNEIIENLGFVDLHSHLIPNIDDGAKNLKQSIELIKSLKEIGYKKLITTPHIMIDAYPNSELDITTKLLNLKLNLAKENIAITIEVAAEYYIDEGFLEHLYNKPLLINSEYLLFETSYMSKPMNLEDQIHEINAKGYKPLFAHPERYRYIKDFDKEYYRFKELGVYFQLDLNSIGGFYGKDAHKKATYLVDKGLVDFIGSDTHNKKHINNLLESLNESNFWYKLFKKNKILNKNLL